jgi:hypothetical protein
MSKQGIKIIGTESNQEPVTHDDLLILVQGNRDRIRDLSNQVLTVCGLVLSAALVVLFFIFQDRRLGIPVVVPILLFCSIGSLIGSLMLAIYACLLPHAIAVGTRAELLDALVVIYHREHRRVILGAGLLVAAIAQFCVGLAVFAAFSL